MVNPRKGVPVGSATPSPLSVKFDPHSVHSRFTRILDAIAVEILPDAVSVGDRMMGCTAMPTFTGSAAGSTWLFARVATMPKEFHATLFVVGAARGTRMGQMSLQLVKRGKHAGAEVDLDRADRRDVIRGIG